MTIQDLFRGVYNLDDFQFLDGEDHEFVLPDADSIKYHELKYEYPYTMQEILSPGTVYKNGPNSPWDVFFFLNNCLFAIQVKSANPEAIHPQTLNKSMIDDAYAKAEAGFNELNKKIPEIENWMLLICINGHKTEDALDELKENFLVHCGNFKDFYGHTFSSRAEFSAGMS